MPVNTEIERSIIREDFSNPYIVGYFLVLTILAAFLAFNYRLYIKNLLVANVSTRPGNEKKREESNMVRKAGNWFNVFFLLTLGLLGYFGLSRLSMETANFSETQLFFISIGLVFVGYALKFITKFFLGFVFEKQGLTSLYFKKVGIRDKAFSVFVLPLLALYYFALPFKEISYWAIISLASVYLALRWISGVITGIKHGNLPYFYSILYICTLEIAPLAICFRAFSMPIVNA